MWGMHLQPRVMAVCGFGIGCLWFANRACADIEYNTISLFNAAQPAYDISQNRPVLSLLRPTIGAINASGQITGTGDAGMDELWEDARPFYYDPVGQTVANLGDLSGDYADQSVSPRNNISRGLGLNDLGWVVGSSSTTTVIEDSDDRPFLWFDDDGNNARSAGEMHELALNPGASYGSAIAVNNNGKVLINGDSGLYLASLSLSNGVVTETAPRVHISGSVFSAKINDAGDVIYQTSDAGYIWRDLDVSGSAEAIEITQVPAMSAVSSISAAYGINETGQVCGTMRNQNNNEVAFIWTDLDGDNAFDWNDTNSNGYFESNESSEEVVRFHGNAAGIGSATGKTFLFDINNHGTTVGTYYEGSDRKGFIYDSVSGMRFLDELIDTSILSNLRQADAINDDGCITAVIKLTLQTTLQFVLLEPVISIPQGDLNGDGYVGLDDLDLVLNNWNLSSPQMDPAADPTGDDFVGLNDLDIVLNNWNKGTPSGADFHVPEPGSLWGLTVVFGVGFARHRWADKT